MRIIKSRILAVHLLSVVCLYIQEVQAQQPDSLDIKIGQMIIIGFGGAEVDKDVLHEVEQGKVGSLIVFEKNIPSKNSFYELKKIIWTYQHAAKIPLFIAIDQEGGRVNRLKEKYGFPPSASAARLGKSTEDSIRFYSQMTAATLAGLGINVNFAPVVDLASNPNNPVIAKIERSYSANADSVSRLACAFVEEHRRFGIINVLKHFPGHGSSQHDTHLGLADVTNTWTTNELIPYQKLIDSARVDAVMTAHIVNRKLDSAGNPGTLSPDIINGILRKKFGFNGVVFSDDMQMMAITKHYGFEEAIRMSINAGVDILMFSNNIQESQLRTVDKVHQIIRRFVDQGAISRQRIDESFRRIMRLKDKLGQDLIMELDKADETLLKMENALDKAKEELEQNNQLIKQLQEGKKKKKRSN